MDSAGGGASPKQASLTASLPAPPPGRPFVSRRHVRQRAAGLVLAMERQRLEKQLNGAATQRRPRQGRRTGPFLTGRRRVVRCGRRCCTDLRRARQAASRSQEPVADRLEPGAADDTVAATISTAVLQGPVELARTVSRYGQH